MAVWTRRLSLALYALAAVMALSSLNVRGDSCCATCLSQTDPKARVITYDPLIHLECSAAVGICCYGCTFSHGSPTYDSGVTFNGDGDPQTTAGTTVTLAIKGVSRITYDFLAVNQAKKSFVGNESNEATADSDGGFALCVRGAGTIAFRGWGDNSCTQVTEEYVIHVAAGDGKASCDAGTVKPGGDSSSSSTTTTKPVPDSTSKPNQTVVPQSGSKTGGDDIENCSITRGAVKTRDDGKKYCECLGDWRNPPFCDSYSWTKTVVTVLGALAAVISIAFSVRAYLKSKKAEKSATETNDLDVMSEHEIETLRISPAKQRESNLSSTSTMAASPAMSSSGVRRSPARTSIVTTSRHETTL